MSGIALQQHERGMVGWLFWSELPAPPRPAGPGGRSRRDPAAPVTAPQPPRCDIVTVLTATL